MSCLLSPPQTGSAGFPHLAYPKTLNPRHTQGVSTTRSQAERVPQVRGTASRSRSRSAPPPSMGTARDQAAPHPVPAASARLLLLRRNHLRGVASGSAAGPAGAAAGGAHRDLDGALPTKQATDGRVSHRLAGSAVLSGAHGEDAASSDGGPSPRPDPTSDKRPSSRPTFRFVPESHPRDGSPLVRPDGPVVGCGVRPPVRNQKTVVETTCLCRG